MILEIIALAVCAIISILIPLVAFGMMIRKNKTQWKSMIAIFLSGGLVYVVMQWGIKEHGLTWLFNNTNFMEFMQQHYIPYLLLVAFAGAALVVFGQAFVVIVPFKRKLTIPKAITFASGYIMVEAIWLVGARSINTMIEIVKGSELELDVSASELFLSGYERVLLFIIEMAIIVVLVYFIQRRMPIRGMLIAMFCYTMVAFIPGFFIAFSLPEYLEVFHRSTALVMVYIILTASALASLVILKVCKNLLDDE